MYDWATDDSKPIPEDDIKEWGHLISVFGIKEGITPADLILVAARLAREIDHLREGFASAYQGVSSLMNMIGVWGSDESDRMMNFLSALAEGEPEGRVDTANFLPWPSSGTTLEELRTQDQANLEKNLETAGKRITKLLNAIAVVSEKRDDLGPHSLAEALDNLTTVADNIYDD